MFKPISERRTVKEILELPDGWTPVIAKANFRRLIKQYHPDVNKTKEAAEYSRKIIKAYNILTGKEKADPKPPQPQQGQVYRYYYYTSGTSGTSGFGFPDMDDIADMFNF